jgi:hypothetical protein
VNDSLELAEEVRIADERTGYIGWAGDVDTYCLAEDATDIRARVSGVSQLDIVLRYVDRATTTSRRMDQHGVGEGEERPHIEVAQAGQTCFEISATSRGASSNAETPYTFVVEPRGDAPTEGP